MVICIIICLRCFLPLWFKQLSIFKVKNIIVEPQIHSSFIRTYISIPESTCILYLDLEDIYKKIKQIYFIEDCSIEKHLPDTIFIKLKTRTPWVVVSDAKRAVIMDRQGFFFHCKRTSGHGILLEWILAKLVNKQQKSKN